MAGSGAKKRSHAMARRAYLLKQDGKTNKEIAALIQKPVEKIPSWISARPIHSTSTGSRAMKVPGWDCKDGTDDEDHDWKIVHDWYGDPDVINGTCDFSYKECRQCGKTAECTYKDLQDAQGDYEYE